jgi:hypothetical protein
LWNDIVTPADDYIIMFPGTQTDTQATFESYSGKIYGCAVLDADITAGGSTFSVKLEDASIPGIFSDGDTIRLTNMADPESSTGTEEILTVSGTPTLSGLTLTITVVETIANDYTAASGGRAMSMYASGDIVAKAGALVITSAAGTYDEGAYPPIMDNVASVHDSFTFTFTDATHFTCVGTYEGNIGSGDTGTDFSPVNSDFTKPFFTLESAGWGGTWASGDTLVLPSDPAATAFVLKRVVPAGTPSLSGNLNTTAISGES